MQRALFESINFGSAPLDYGRGEQFFLLDSIESSKNFRSTTQQDTCLCYTQKLLQFLPYKQLSEPNTCGFGRMSAMNTDITYEYTDLTMNIYSLPS